jgi:hypothetical protein
MHISRGRHEHRIAADDAVRFRRGEVGSPPVSILDVVPEIIREGEGFRPGVRPDVERRGGSSVSQHHDVVPECIVAALQESRLGGLLQDAERPALRKVDRVVHDLRVHGSHERERRIGADEDVAVDADVRRLVVGSLRTEELESGGAADVDGAGTTIDERVSLDRDMARSPFRLYAVGACPLE